MYCDAGDQDREGPRGAAQGRDLGRGLLFPRHRFRAASGGEEARRSTASPASSMRRSRSRPTPRCSRRKARSTSSKPLPRSTARSITACRRTRSASRSKRRRGPRRRRSRSTGPDERALVYRGGETIEWKVVDVSSQLAMPAKAGMAGGTASARSTRMRRHGHGIARLRATANERRRHRRTKRGS